MVLVLIFFCEDLVCSYSISLEITFRDIITSKSFNVLSRTGTHKRILKWKKERKLSLFCYILQQAESTLHTPPHRSIAILFFDWFVWNILCDLHQQSWRIDPAYHSNAFLVLWKERRINVDIEKEKRYMLSCTCKNTESNFRKQHRMQTNQLTRYIANNGKHPFFSKFILFSAGSECWILGPTLPIDAVA